MNSIFGRFRRSPQPAAQIHAKEVVESIGQRRNLTRQEARAIIVDAAQRSSATPSLYSMRRINQAVCVVRRNRLVDAKVLTAAGFRAVAR